MSASDAVTLSRRSFLGGALALTAASAVPAYALKSPAPVIYADGIHDDTAGLQAALDGEPFRVFGDGVFIVRNDGHIYIGKGAFRLSDTLHLRGSVPVTLSDFHMRWDRLPPDAACVMVSPGARHTLLNGVLIAPEVGQGHYGIYMP